jgi:periplasmic copper chaperone A
MKNTLLTFAAAIALSLPVLAAAHESDAHQIEHSMKRQFDRPDAPLQVAPVTVVGEHAVAGWTQQARGGRALLRKDKAGWSITLCAGDGLLQPQVLASAGVPAAQARQLAAAVGAAEARLPAAQRQLFASFEGVVKVQAGHGHTPAAHTGHPPAAKH